MPVTNIPSARRIANIAVNDAMILPYDAIQGPDGIFGKDRCTNPDSSYGWTSNVSPLDAFMSVKMGTFREFQLYMVW